METSHSSRCQPSFVHHSPEVRHGPAQAITSARAFSKNETRRGLPACTSMRARIGGRNKRSERLAALEFRVSSFKFREPCLARYSVLGTRNFFILCASGR